MRHSLDTASHSLSDNENKDMRILLSSQRSEQDPEVIEDSAAGIALQHA